MQVPLEIVFHNVDRSAAVEAAVRERAAKLEEFAENITSCRVTVESPHKHHQQGNLYTVRVDLRFPGGEAVANRSPSEKHAHEDVYVAVHSLFIGSAPGAIHMVFLPVHTPTCLARFLCCSPGVAAAMHACMSSAVQPAGSFISCCPVGAAGAAGCLSSFEYCAIATDASIAIRQDDTIQLLRRCMENLPSELILLAATHTHGAPERTQTKITLRRSHR